MGRMELGGRNNHLSFHLQPFGFPDSIRFEKALPSERNTLPSDASRTLT